MTDTAPNSGLAAAEPVAPAAAATMRQIEKLNKINAALIQRVERSMDRQANAYSLFQTAISLEAQIRHRTDELNNALSNLERVNAELSSARDIAERANRFKTRFFTAVGHDLLQPLHAARLTLSELTEAQLAPESQRLAGNIAHALGSIEDLLATILDISKLEAGAFTPNIQPVVLGDVFEQLAVSTEPSSRNKGLSLRIRPTSLTVQSDPLMLRRILQNLLANAVHYTQRGGLLIAARPRGSNVSIEVWDTGPGIAPAEQERIFEEFQRGAASERAGGAGFGLGLAIVKRMSEALQHPVELRSRVGRGTRFSLLVPRATAAAPRLAALSSTLLSTEPGLLARRLIVIDNDLTVLGAMQTLLTRWGADVHLARDLDDIAAIIADGAFEPAAVLADYHLDGGVLGLAAVARIRERFGKAIPSILITADRSEATADEARRADCELLHKPVRPAELRALLQHLLR